MLITGFSTHLSVMRKEDPTWKFALGASPVIEGVILRLTTTDGIVGFGYASAVPHMGSIAAQLDAELKHLEPAVTGRDAGDIESIMDSLWIVASVERRKLKLL